MIPTKPLLLRGLSAPPAILAATAEYRTESDRIGAFLEAATRPDPDGKILSRHLFACYEGYAAAMEFETARFYRKAAETARDASVRELLVKLAEAEDKHESLAERLSERILTEGFHNEGPTFSPNGRVIMFFRDPGGNAGPSLYTIDISGRNDQRVPTPSYASDPAWSPLLS